MLAELPLLAEIIKTNKNNLISKILTADGCGLLENSGNFGVHLDHEILFIGGLLVPGVHLVLDPFAKSVFKDRCADVANPLLGRLG